MNTAVYDKNNGIVMVDVIDVIKKQPTTPAERELARLNAFYGKVYGDSIFRNKIAVRDFKTPKINNIVIEYDRYDFDAEELRDTDQMTQN